MVTPEPGGTTRGRPREEVECMRRVSLMTLWRLSTINSQYQHLERREKEEEGEHAKASPSQSRTQAPPHHPV